MADRIPLEAQISEVERELRMRRTVYPRMVGSKQMRQSEADLAMQRMEAIRDTLVWLLQHEGAIREAVAAGVTRQDGEKGKAA